ncbi:MAG: hypothetical protein V4724_02525 [Pseudomonadota bacterium]
MQKSRTEHVIEELIAVTCVCHAGERERHVFAQALHGLVRLAKAEQLVEMRLDTERVGGALASASRRRQTRAMLRKIGIDIGQQQRELQQARLLGRGASEPCRECEDGMP